jgi:uncharacterized protein (TIGR03067 family)
MKGRIQIKRMASDVVLGAVVLFLVVAATRAMAATADAPDQAAKRELTNLQGTWTVVYSEVNGERRRDLEEVKKMRLTIKEDKWTLEYYNNVKDKHVATLKLEPTQKPKAVDFKFSEGLLTGETLLAIYELKGDDLKFCFADESRLRPKNFDSREGIGGHWLLVLKREK